MTVEKLPDLVAVMMPRDTAEGIREALRDVERDDPVAVRYALARREQSRLDEARAAGVATDVADWRGREWLWRSLLQPTPPGKADLGATQGLVAGRFTG
ncbi:Uncharacterised protein [Amycolatopsis camponoti]|uniref:Uncharacterized protein n=1 Tax=Amycolatopsis camponoti TaxID=2606593 RepID=A0A6I8LPJ7_9PSEU|nr:hypothetical protein [Amycolatopsis camponoti]VVJ19674.1 Uncharacterised protein [Amycolatopsis camponoti]